MKQRRYEVWLDCREDTTATGAIFLDYTKVTVHPTLAAAVAEAEVGDWVYSAKDGRAGRVER